MRLNLRGISRAVAASGLGALALAGCTAPTAARTATTTTTYHFDSYVGVPRWVAAGETIGLVGNTGDAAGGPTHVHFEIHPNHGDAVDAYPSDAAHCRRLTSPPPAS